MSKKITIVEQFAEIEKFLVENGKTEMAEFIKGRAELHAKKNATRKPTATQKANEILAKTILDFMAENSDCSFTITDLIKKVPACAELTNQKVSAVVRGLVENKAVVKTVLKGTSLFSIA